MRWMLPALTCPQANVRFQTCLSNPEVYTEGGTVQVNATLVAHLRQEPQGKRRRMPVGCLWQAAAPLAAQLLVAVPLMAQRSLRPLAAWLHMSHQA